MVRIVCISDTHNRLSRVLDRIPSGDILIHAGDFSVYGSEKEIEIFNRDMSNLPHPHKILVPGNHDLMFESDPEKALDLLDSSITCLLTEQVVVEGIKIWGSSLQPEFHDWAFNRSAVELEEHWKTIPDDADVVITHTPPYGILDQVPERVGPVIQNRNCGDIALRRELINRVRPRAHIFGHIHEAYGHSIIQETHYINASILDGNFRVANRPFILHLEADDGRGS